MTTLPVHQFEAGLPWSADGSDEDRLAVLASVAAGVASRRASATGAPVGFARAGSLRLQRAVDSLPYLGPLLVAAASSISIYDLLLLVRLLVLDG